MRIAFASTPVGYLGSGIGGGVESGVQGLTSALTRLGHTVEVFAPIGSQLVDAVVHQFSGNAQSLIQNCSRQDQLQPVQGTVLNAIWEALSDQQDRFDIIVNFAYDALPMNLTAKMLTPTVHLISMASLTDAMDKVIVATSHLHKFAVAMHTDTQRSTFVGLSKDVLVVGSGVDLAKHQFSPNQSGPLGFIGRISPEKGISDAISVAQRSGLPLEVWGLMHDEKCYADALAQNPSAVVNYRGFVSQDKLAMQIGEIRSLLVTSKWVEAFGNVIIEAMASGVPVICYNRGGPAEIVQDGINGFLVDPDDIDQMVGAVQKVGSIERSRCRQLVESNYSMDSFASKVESWLIARLG